MLFWAEGLWTAEPDTVPRPGELRCGPLVGLLGSGEDADGRAHLPLPGTVAAGLPGSVECRRRVSTGITEHEQGGPAAG